MLNYFKKLLGVLDLSKLVKEVSAKLDKHVADTANEGAEEFHILNKDLHETSDKVTELEWAVRDLEAEVKELAAKLSKKSTTTKKTTTKKKDK